MKKRHVIASASGLAGLLIVLGIVIAVNVILRTVRVRSDLTEDRVYTLSPGTKSLVGGLPRTVTLKFYFSRGGAIPVQLRQFGQRVADLLREYEAAGRGRVVLEFHDPAPDSDEEEWAQRYGLTPQALNAGGFSPDVYLGLVASCGTKEAVIPFLAPSMEPQFEYQITRLIHEITRPARARIGVLSSLPVMGAPPQMGMPPTLSRGWALAGELRRQYDVVPIDGSAARIPDDVGTLLLIHPKRMSDRMMYAIDQFVLRGGRLLAFVDPLCVTEREAMGEYNPYGGADFSSDLPKLFQAWGIEYSPMDVAADAAYASQVSFGPQGSERLATWLSIRAGGIDRDLIATSALELLMLPFAGGFHGTPAEGLTLTPLVHTSPGAALVSSFEAAQMGPQKMQNARAQGQMNLAVRLQGTFRTAFPNGQPREPESPEGEQAAEAGLPPPLKESRTNGVVVLVADVDLLYDAYSLRAMNFFGQPLYQPINDNLNLALNLVEEMAGSDALIGLRSRGRFIRPFDRVLEMERRAQEQWQQEEIKLMTRLQETQARINELQSTKDEDQEFILSPEQKKEIENFRQERFETQRQLKQVRKNLRSEIERLGVVVKAINLAGMPLVVAAFGLVHGLHRRRASR